MMEKTILYIISAILTVALVIVLSKKTENVEKNKELMQETNLEKSTIEGEQYMWVSLTVSESKRLIAKGLMQYEPVKERLHSGEMIVTRGTTNHYFREELLGAAHPKGEFLTGNIQPKGKKFTPNLERHFAEMYLKDGIVQELSYDAALEQISVGALLFKGANQINYTLGQAVVLIGASTGGTTAKLLPHVESGKAKLIIPVGLEKNSSYNLVDLANDFSEKRKGSLRMFVLPGELFTEIEALKQFANVEVLQIASGGINGAEGAVSLSIRGTAEELAKAKLILNEIHGEVPFY